MTLLPFLLRLVLIFRKKTTAFASLLDELSLASFTLFLPVVCHLDVQRQGERATSFLLNTAMQLGAKPFRACGGWDRTKNEKNNNA